MSRYRLPWPLWSLASQLKNKSRQTVEEQNSLVDFELTCSHLAVLFIADYAFGQFRCQLHKNCIETARFPVCVCTANQLRINSVQK